MTWSCFWNIIKIDIGSTFIQQFFGKLFFITDDINIPSYANDNTPNMSAKTIDEVIESSQQAANTLFNWSKDNLLKEMLISVAYQPVLAVLLVSKLEVLTNATNLITYLTSTATFQIFTKKQVVKWMY